MQTRSFCFVDDLVSGLINLMNSNYTLPINLGNPEEFSINEIAEIIRIDSHPSFSEIIYKELPEDDPLQRKPIIKLAQEKLNWSPLASPLDEN